MTRAGRLLRAGLIGGAIAAFAISASASFQGPAPTINGASANPPGLSAYIVTPGQTLTVRGNNFYTDAPLPTDNCSYNSGTLNAPSVVFTSLDSKHSVSVQPISTDAANCSDTMMNIKVPAAFSDGTPLNNSAFIRVTDCCGQSSPTNGVVPIVTVHPAATGMTPNSGDVTVHTVTITGSNFNPASFVAGSFSATFNGGPLSLLSAGPTSFSFNPQNAGGPVAFSYQVRTDLNDASKVATAGGGAGTYTFHAPAVSGVSPQESAVGGHVKVSGAWLGNSGSVKVGGVSAPAAWSGSSGAQQLDVTIPAGAPDSSPLTVSVNGWPTALTGIGPVVLDPVAVSVSPQSAVPGSPIRVSGTNLGSSPGVVTMAGAQQGVTSWSPTAFTFTLGDDVDSAPVAMTRASDGKTATAGVVTVVPKLTQLEQTTLQPGAALVIDGVGFGSGQGSVSIGSAPATPQLWSRKQVLVAVPAGITPGAYKVSVVGADGTASVNQLTLTIAAPPPTPKPGTSASPAQSNPFQPHFDNKHDFVKPIPPPSPVKMTLDAEPKKVVGGGTSTLTVTLTLNGKPVIGAQVKLSMIFTPCSGQDKFSADSGATDTTGTFKSSITLCSQTGQHVILAESGLFSDQDAVDTTAPAGKSGSTASSGTSTAGVQTNPASGIPAPLIALGAIAAALVGVGVYVNLRSHGWV